MSLVLTGSVYPFLKRLTSDLAGKHTGALALIQTHLDALIGSIAKVIFSLIQTSGNSWPNEWADSSVPSGFCQWLRPLIPFGGGILSAFLSKLKGCVGQGGQDLSTQNWRGCLETLSRIRLEHSDQSHQDLVQVIKPLAEHYARHDASLADIDDALQDFKFLITVLDVPSSLAIFSERFKSKVSLVHSGACPTVVLNDQLDLTASCHCQMRVDLINVVKKIKKFGSQADPYRAWQAAISDKVTPALSVVMRAWFKKHLLVSPPKMMSEALREDLPDASPCQANCGRSACDTVRDFLRGTLHADKQIMFIEDLGPRISEHLLSHWSPAGFEYSVPWDITRLSKGIQIEKEDETMWRPAQWKSLQAYGEMLLHSLSCNGDILRKILGDDYEAIHDAVRNLKPALPLDEPDLEDNAEIKEDPAVEVAVTGVGEVGVRNDESPEGDGGKEAKVEAGPENVVVEGRVATAPKAVAIQRVAEDADEVEPPSKKQKTA